MIQTLSDLYKTVSQQLPGVSQAVLETEFKKAEHRACSEAGIWAADYAFTTQEGVYEYEVALPEHANLHMSLNLRDGEARRVDVNEYDVESIPYLDAPRRYEVDAIDGTTPDPLVAGVYTETTDVDLWGYPQFRSPRGYRIVASGEDDTSLSIEVTAAGTASPEIAGDYTLNPRSYGEPPVWSSAFGGYEIQFEPGVNLWLISSPTGAIISYVFSLYSKSPPQTGWSTGATLSAVPNTVVPVANILLTPDAYEAYLLNPYARPTDYALNTYTEDPPAGVVEGTYEGRGAFPGDYLTELLPDDMSALFTLDDRLVDSRYPEVFTSELILTPESGRSAAPATVLTQHAELITTLALAALLNYSKNFPWSDPNKASQMETKARRLLSLAKYKRYRGLKRTTLTLRSPSFI